MKSTNFYNHLIQCKIFVSGLTIKSLIDILLTIYINLNEQIISGIFYYLLITIWITSTWIFRKNIPQKKEQAKHYYYFPIVPQKNVQIAINYFPNHIKHMHFINYRWGMKKMLIMQR